MCVFLCGGCEDEEVVVVVVVVGISMIEYPSLFHLLSARVSEHAAHFQAHRGNPPPILLYLPLSPQNMHCLWATGLAAKIQRAGGCGLK